jgi:glycosyltransferase involved in cell wall biosynthesis
VNVTQPDGSRSQLRVVHVVASLTTGGAERHIESLTRLSRHHQSVICLYERGLVAEAIEAGGTRVQFLGMNGWRKPLATLRLARALRRDRPDVVHVHLLAAQLWGIPAARLAGIPVVVSTEHSIMETTIEGRPKTAWLRRLYRGLEAATTKTVAVSRATAFRLAEWGVPPDHVEVVELGVDFDALAFDPTARVELRRELSIATDTKLVIAVGRLEPVKRFGPLLQASAPLLLAGELELLIVGNGALRDVLEQQARDLGVAHRVRFLGPRADVPALLSAADLLVSPSRDETFGLAVIEGLGAGLPVIYAQCPALDTLDQRPAEAHPLPLFRADDADGEIVALREALASVGFGPGLRHHPPADLLARYDIRAAAAAVDALYERLSGIPQPELTTSPAAH